MSEETERVWNTLHPDGYVKFLEMYASFLINYDGGADRFGTGAVVGAINAICGALEQLGLNDLDWQEFKRRHPILAGEKEEGEE